MFVIISILVSGLIVGALGRLAIPGPNPMSIGKTLLVGIGGSIIGGLVGALLFRDAEVVQVILQVIAAAGIVYFLQRRNT